MTSGSPSSSSSDDDSSGESGHVPFFSVFSLKIQCIIVPPSLFSDELESGPQASSVCNSTVLIDSDNDTEEYDDMDIEVVSEHINVKIVKENLRQKGE